MRSSRTAATGRAAVNGAAQNGQNGNSPGNSLPQEGQADTGAVYGGEATTRIALYDPQALCAGRLVLDLTGLAQSFQRFINGHQHRRFE